MSRALRREASISERKLSPIMVTTIIKPRMARAEVSLMMILLLMALNNDSHKGKRKKAKIGFFAFFS